MRLRCSSVLLVASACVVASGACSSAPPEEAATDTAEWVGTINSDGDVTTVVNEAGSVWGGDAELSEDVSIGVEAGADEYMFGRVQGVWATDDRIIVVDSQVPAVRVYDHAGAHVMDIGGEGQGPGEFTDPAGLVVDEEGNILIVERNLQVEVYGPEGQPKATWNSGSPFSVGMFQMIVLGFDGEVWVPQVERDPIRFGYARIDGGGDAGEAIFPPDPGWEPPCLTFQRRGQETSHCNIPFFPFARNALLRDGGWVVGVSDEYAFDVHRPDGTTLEVKRFWDPVPVGDDEAAYRRQQTIDLINERMSADPKYVWNGPEIPSHKPAWVQLMPDHDGRIWVLREQESVLTSECLEDVPECWMPAGYWLDAFGADGRYLGTTTFDRRLGGWPYIDGTTVIAAEIDEAGTYRVTKYRLETGTEESQ